MSWVVTPHGWPMTIKMSIKLKHQYNKQSTVSPGLIIGRVHVINYFMSTHTDGFKIVLRVAPALSDSVLFDVLLVYIVLVILRGFTLCFVTVTDSLN